jgi:hypothetical protein
MHSDMDGLGRIISTYAVSPAQLQRAVFVAVLSFLFFMAMMFAFYLRQNILYFLLATAFLLTYLVTMLSWVIQRRATLQIHEKGLRYKKFTAMWAEIESVTDTPPFEVRTTGGQTFVLPGSIAGAEQAARNIRSRISAAGN